MLGVLVLSCSCKEEVRKREVQDNIVEMRLAEIDTLIWQQPDSALACLLSYFDTCRRDAMIASPETPRGDSIETHAMRLYNRHYAHLLLAELLYKNYQPQTNRPELLEAVGYFDSLVAADTRGVSLQGFRRRDARRASAQNTAFLTARAHYINGVGYYEQDSVVPACKEYLKALEVMEENFEEKELVRERAQFMALTYTRLTVLFSDVYLHEQAIYFGKKSLEHYNRFRSMPWQRAWILTEIGAHFDMINGFDTANLLYKEALQLLPDTDNITYRDIITHQAVLSYKMGDFPEKSIELLHSIIAQADSHKEYYSRCMSIGEIYYNQSRFDSAWYYLKKVYDHTHSIASKKQAAEWLVEIGEAHGKSEEASEFALFLVPFANMEENQSATKSQLAELYNEYRQAQLQQQQHNEAKKHAKQLLWTIVGLLIIVTPILIISHRRNKKQKQDLETQIEAERHSHQMQQAALSGRLKRSNAALKEKSLSSAAIPMSKYSPQYTQVENYAEEPICKQILSTCNDKNKPIKSTVPVSAYADIALSDAQKAELGNVALRHYGQLFDKLKERYPELKGKDLLYCQLSLLGLDNTQIAVLLQKSISTIWERENRLKKIFGSEDNVSVILHKFLID